MNIVIVDDHPLIQQGLKAILALEKDMELKGEATDIDEALAIITRERPDIVLVDLKLGVHSGFDLIKLCKEKEIACKIIVFTAIADLDDFRYAQELGVDGYLLKTALPDEFISALRIVSRGRKYYDSGLLELMVNKKKSLYDLLSQRERDVLLVLGDGFSNKEIAQKLCITEHTVKKHLTQVLAKLELADRTQAAIYVNRMRSISGR